MEQRQLPRQARRGLRFFRLYLLQTSVSTLVLLPLMGGIAWLGGATRFAFFPAFLITVALIALVQLPATWLLARFWSYRVLPDGIEGPNFWGRRQLLAWNDIESATERRFSGQPYVVARATDGREIWISAPGYIEGGASFLEEIFDSAPPGNPLRERILNR